MRLLKNRQNLLSIAMLGLLLALAVPGTALAVKRDRSRDRDDDKRDRKCAKFVNCHDARDGRAGWQGAAREIGMDETGMDDTGMIETGIGVTGVAVTIGGIEDVRGSTTGTDRRFDAREINRQNTDRFRRVRG